MFIYPVNIINKKNLYFIRKYFAGPAAGFTLIELLISITVFLIGIMAAFSLSLYNLNTSKDNANRVIAADLAREGIEIVRNIRDSNWLALEADVDSDPSTPLTIELYAWDHGLDLANFLVQYDNNSIMPFTNAPANIEAAIADDESKLYLFGDFYKHGGNSSDASLFRRAINLRAVCLNTATKVESVSNNLICSGTDEKIGLQITSRVRYIYGNKTNTIDAVEKIYNWRQ